jgi:hypothetical protein
MTPADLLHVDFARQRVVLSSRHDRLSYCFLLICCVEDSGQPLICRCVVLRGGQRRAPAAVAAVGALGCWACCLGLCGRGQPACRPRGAPAELRRELRPPGLPQAPEVELNRRRLTILHLNITLSHSRGDWATGRKERGASVTTLFTRCLSAGRASASSSSSARMLHCAERAAPQRANCTRLRLPQQPPRAPSAAQGPTPHTPPASLPPRRPPSG